MIVMKFGGTSVESAAAIERVAGIVRAREERRPVVVVSAMGKTTNKLLAIASVAIEGERHEYLRQIHDLRDMHSREARKVVPLAERAELDRMLDEHFQELTELAKGLAVLGELTPRSIDAISSYGERLSSYIVTLAFRHFGMHAVHVDSRDVIITDRRHTQAAPNFPETYKRLAETIPPLARDAVVVMGGFIGSTLEGVTSTLGRGGSDFTASIVGAGIGAEEIQIWTDVDGMLTADPTILPGGHRVKTISFAEAAELAYFGAKVLHPATVVPAIEKNIPVMILNSRRPDVPGTRIISDRVPCDNVVKSIACKRRISLVNIHSSRMLMAHGFLHRIFEVFDRLETPVDMVSTSEVSVSLTIDNTRNLEAILADLREFAEVEFEHEQAIVCLVGENIRFTPGVARRVFNALDGINIRMISQGASLLNISFVVAERDLRATVEALHGEFFGTLDPDVFEPSGAGFSPRGALAPVGGTEVPRGLKPAPQPAEKNIG
jgi:aspartate kinase